MKKLILLLFIPLVFTCSSDSSDDNTDNTVPVDDTNPVYLAENGVTVGKVGLSLEILVWLTELDILLLI